MVTQPNSDPPFQGQVDRLLEEGLLSIVDAAEAEGLRISPKTTIRWALHGTGGVRLETVKVGGRRLTSRAAIRRFVAAQQHDEVPHGPVIDAKAADRILEAHGLGRGGRR